MPRPDRPHPRSAERARSLEAEFREAAAKLGPGIAEELRDTARRRLDAAKALIRAKHESERDYWEQAAEAAARAKAAAERSPSVRSVLGLASYRSGHFKVAVAELMAYRRMSGDRRLDPVIADAHRGLGSPGKALAFLDPLQREDVDARTWALAVLVRAGALADQGNTEGAKAVLSLAGLKAVTPAGSLRPDVFGSTARTRPRKSGPRSVG